MKVSAEIHSKTNQLLFKTLRNLEAVMLQVRTAKTLLKEEKKADQNQELLRLMQIKLKKDSK